MVVITFIRQQQQQRNKYTASIGIVTTRATSKAPASSSSTCSKQETAENVSSIIKWKKSKIIDENAFE